MPATAPFVIAQVIAEAKADQTAAVLSLLPELLQAPALSTRFVVAHLAGHPSRIVGAAAFAPAMQAAPSAGFRGQCRVLEGFRRRGVGRALVARLAAEVAAWDVTHLLAWQAEPEGPSTAFMQALGFRVDYSLQHFIGDYSTMHPFCERMMHALRAHGRVRAGYRLLPLADAPLAPVIELHCAEFDADPGATRAAIEAALADPLSRRLSLALWHGDALAGYLLAGRGTDMPEIRFWASHPAHRSGWPAMLLLDAYTRLGTECGVRQTRFVGNNRNLAPLNVARKIGAKLEAVHRGYVLDLARAGS